MFRQILGGVGYCHMTGTAHRDLKCENIMLDKNMDAKIGKIEHAEKRPQAFHSRRKQSSVGQHDRRKILDFQISIVSGTILSEIAKPATNLEMHLKLEFKVMTPLQLCSQNWMLLLVETARQESATDMLLTDVNSCYR